MGKAKKTRKFAAVKRLINVKKDRRVHKDQIEKSAPKKNVEGELVREM